MGNHLDAFCISDSEFHKMMASIGHGHFWFANHSKRACDNNIYKLYNRNTNQHYSPAINPSCNSKIFVGSPLEYTSHAGCFRGMLVLMFLNKLTCWLCPVQCAPWGEENSCMLYNIRLQSFFLYYNLHGGSLISNRFSLDLREFRASYSLMDFQSYFSVIWLVYTRQD